MSEAVRCSFNTFLEHDGHFFSFITGVYQHGEGQEATKEWSSTSASGNASMEDIPSGKVPCTAS
jgi:hypothetical protein